MNIFRKSTEAFAKINLLLRITGIRRDGYHLLSTVMQTVSISDTVEMEIDFSEGSVRTLPEISLGRQAEGAPSDVTNTMYRAADAFLKKIGSPPVHVTIRTRKRIPVQAGLGGGSADAAAVLKLMNEAYSGALTRAGMISIAQNIGADVPFFLDGGAALCEGVGERITPLSALPGLPLLIIKPKRGVSTPEAYRAFDLVARDFSEGIGENREMMRILSANEESSLARLQQIVPFISNDLQSAAIGLVPEIARILEFFEKLEPVCSSVTGSGSAVFAVFDHASTRDFAARAAEGLRVFGFEVFSCETLG